MDKTEFGSIGRKFVAVLIVSIFISILAVGLLKYHYHHTEKGD